MTLALVVVAKNTNNVMVNKHIWIALLGIAFFSVSAFLIKDGGLTIRKSEEIQKLQDQKKVERVKLETKTKDGFRVLLLFTDDKAKADGIKSKFVSQISNEIPCEVEWDEPKFKVYAGNFYSRAEAVSLLYKVRGTFTSAIIVKTKIK
jgi:hypothetical protein